MKFSITFDSASEFRKDHAIGHILLGHSTESFESSLLFWTEQDYEQHWRAAISRLIEGHSTSALITNMHDPQHANFLVSWPLWRLGNRVHIQNHLLFLDELPEPFDISRYFDFVGARETHSDDGQIISEWVIELAEFSKFLQFNS